MGIHWVHRGAIGCIVLIKLFFVDPKELAIDIR